MNIDIKNLTATTKAAIQQGEEAARQLRVKEQAKLAAQRRIDDAKAAAIIAQVPARAAKEAEAGRNHAVIMGLSYGDWTGTESRNSITRSQLIGVARIVYDAVDSAGLAPTLEFWHDGMGVQSGYNIVIHWPK